MMRAIEHALRAGALLMMVATAGCTGDRLEWPGQTKDKAPPLAINMAGRWMLTSPNRGQCGMNFTGAPKATEGSIAPEGGCPGSFFTSRKWAIEEGNVVIRDHNGEQLVQLSPSGSGSTAWFEGQATSGERVMLARR